VICQAGKPVARLAPYSPPRRKPRLGLLKDAIKVKPGWDSPETDAEIQAMFDESLNKPIEP
jgi:antitoxin (DNA-binding transcriptional repressor) of toxin-antitoxin stability system